MASFDLKLDASLFGLSPSFFGSSAAYLFPDAFDVEERPHGWSPFAPRSGDSFQLGLGSSFFDSLIGDRCARSRGMSRLFSDAGQGFSLRRPDVCLPVASGLGCFGFKGMERLGLRMPSLFNMQAFFNRPQIASPQFSPIPPPAQPPPPQPMSTSSSNVRVSSGSGSEPANGLSGLPQNPDELSPEDVEGVRKQLSSNKAGLNKEDAEAVAKEMEKAADGSREEFEKSAAAFPRMSRAPSDEELEKISPEKQEEFKDKREAEWQRAYGKWRTQHIEKIDPKDAGTVVDRALFEPDDPKKIGGGELELQPTKTKSKDGAKAYKITGDPQFGGYKQGGSLYQKSGKWYRDAKCAEGSEIKGATFDKKKLTIPESTEPAMTKDDVLAVERQDGLKKFGDAYYDVYKVSEPAEGDKEAQKVWDSIPEEDPGNQRKLYYDPNTKKFFRLKEKNSQELVGVETKGILPNGRELIFKRAPRTKLANAFAPVADLDEAVKRGAEDLKEELKGADEIRQRSTDERVKGFEGAWNSGVCAEVKKVLGELKRDGKNFTVTIDSKDADAAAALFADGGNEAVKAFGQAFKVLPRDVHVTVNGRQVSGDARQAFLRAAEYTPRPLEIGDVSLSSAENVDAAEKLLLEKVKAKIEERHNRKPSEIKLGKVTVGEKVTEEQFKKMVGKIAVRYGLASEQVKVEKVAKRVVYNFREEDLEEKPLAAQTPAPAAQPAPVAGSPFEKPKKPGKYAALGANANAQGEMIRGAVQAFIPPPCGEAQVRRAKG